MTPGKFRRSVRAGNQLVARTAVNMGFLWIFFALAAGMGLYGHSLQKSAFPDAGYSPGQISVTVYVSTGPARLTLKSFVFLNPQGDTLSVNVTGPKAVSDPWLLIVQCPAEPGLVSANHGVELWSEGTSGKQQLGDVIVTHHDHRNWSGPLGCFKQSKSTVTTGLVQNQNIDATLPVLEQNPSAQSAQADTPLYVERSSSEPQPIKDLVEVLQPPDSSCPPPYPLIDACLHLLRLEHGAGVANAVARRMVVPPHRDGGQAQFITPLFEEAGDAADGGMAAVHDWAVAHLDESVTVADLAARALMSPRNFARQFVARTGATPHQWLTSQRLMRAQELLERGESSVEQVASQCGLTPLMLRRHFARRYATTPQAYRRTFSQSGSVT